MRNLIVLSSFLKPLFSAAAPAAILAAAIISLAPAAACALEPRVPDWIALKCDFASPPELGAISAVRAKVLAPLFDVEGAIECVLPDTCRPVAPLSRTAFTLKKGESHEFSFQIQFVSASAAKNVAVRLTMDFPAAQMKKYVEASEMDATTKKRLLDKIGAASSRFELVEQLEFMVTEREGFSGPARDIFQLYTPEGYVMADYFDADLPPGEKGVPRGALESEIRKLEEAITLVRGNAELKRYLATSMDVVSSEDRLMRLLLIAGNERFAAKDADGAERYYRKIIADASGKVMNADTSEIFVDASMNLSVLLLADPARSEEGLKTLGAAREKCAAAANAKIRYALYNEGIYYRNAKQNLKASACFRKALAVKPNFTACSSELSKLER